MTANPDVLTQYEVLTGKEGSGAGVANLTGRTLLEVTGADRASLLHSFCTNEVNQLPPGRGCEAFVTSPQGKCLGHVWIFNIGTALLVGTVPGQAERLIAHWSRYVISEDVTFRDLSPETGTLLVAGPGAAALLYSLSTLELPNEAPNLVAATIHGLPVHIGLVEFAAARCFFFFASNSATKELLAAIRAAGAELCSSEAVEMARLEQGFPLYGRDITDDNLPQEIGRNRQAISFTKGCYLGQETVARIDALGHVNRLLAGVKFAGPGIPVPGTKLLAADKEVGHVTSAAWSPKYNAPLALALLRRAQAKPGTELTSEAGVAEVVAPPTTQ